MGKKLSTLPAVASPNSALRHCVQALDTSAEPDDLARRIVEVAVEQPGVEGARLWRNEGGASAVWHEAGTLPRADPAVVPHLGGHSARKGMEATANVWGCPLGGDPDSSAPARVLEIRGEGPFDPTVCERLALLGCFAGLALESCERRHAVEEFSSIIEATKRLNSTLDLAELINIILQIATRQSGADRGTVFLVDRHRDEIWSLVGLGLEQQEIRLPAAQGIAGWVARHGETVNLPDVYADPRFSPEVDRRLGYRTRAVLCLPIRNKGGETIGVLQLLNKRVGSFNSDDEGFLRALSDHVALALENAQLHRERLARQQLERDLELAHRIQAGLLPECPPKLAGFDIAVSHRASQAVGGDYYDFVALGSKTTLLVIADVEGKGVASALVMANLQATLRALATHVQSVERLVAGINQMILADTRERKFLSMFAGLLDHETRRLDYVNAGHVPPAVVRSSSQAVYLSEGGILIGAFPDITYKRGSVQLESGDIFVGCTDGITEAEGKKEQTYGPERLVEAVYRWHSDPAQQIVESVLEEVEVFSRGGTGEDDRILLVIKVL